MKRISKTIPAIPQREARIYINTLQGLCLTRFEPALELPHENAASPALTGKECMKWPAL